jgi:hypothetical protein
MLRGEPAVTEEQWWLSINPGPMLSFLRGAAGDRKLRLFACACLRRVQDLFADREAFAVVERFADGLATPAELVAAVGRADPRVGAPADADRVGESVAWAAAASAALRAVSAGDPNHPIGQGDYYAAEAGERAAQCRLLREILGNPFRPVAFDPAWRSPSAVGVAQRMYDNGDFDAMPVLADALQDAGCEVPDVLDHCRRPREHVRGCWVVDLALGVA